jgi:hypothetical protein
MYKSVSIDAKGLVVQPRRKSMSEFDTKGTSRGSREITAGERGTDLA